ncbi:hypothetical protein [Thermococcus sp.]|uniref:hypothetical protein n=1 Tax=Thermococcus sp. TaxID=35749 RepID=UPI002639A2D0|nr:hypothetical protein [Thermococcus sp.]
MDSLEVLERRVEYLDKQIALLRSFLEEGQKELVRLTRVKQQTIHEISRLKKGRVTKTRKVVTV